MRMVKGLLCYPKKGIDSSPQTKPIDVQFAALVTASFDMNIAEFESRCLETGDLPLG